jgi:hypothetical protein
MIVVEYQDVELDWCPDCGGIWFDNEELEFLLQGAGLDIEALDMKSAARADTRRAGEHTRRCTRCRRRMRKLGVGGQPPVILDNCPRHGLWFDGGELSAVLRAAAPPGEWARVSAFLGALFPGHGRNKEADS